jgi:hypothetical protein
MSKDFTPEEKAAILQRARDLLAEPLAAQASSHERDQSDLHFSVPTEDLLTKWKREGDEQMARQQAERDRRDFTALERRITNNIMEAMQGLIDTAISNARADHLKNFLPELLFQFKHDIHDEVCAMIENAYAKAFADVRADLALLRATIRKFTGDDNTVIDMPSLRVGKPTFADMSLF